jgi:hypothetical protein
VINVNVAFQALAKKQDRKIGGERCHPPPF